MFHYCQKLSKLLAVYLAVVGLAFAQKANLSPDLAAANGNNNVNVIVRFKHQPSDSDHQRILQLGGGALLNKLHSVKGGFYSLPAAALARIAADPGVAYVSPDRTLHGKLDLTAAAINASVAWNSGWDGSGVGVAVIDSGVVQVADLYDPSGKFRVVYEQDFTGGGPQDQYGHGTHVSGIIAGNAKWSTCSSCTRSFRGIAPNANLLDLRVLERERREHGQHCDRSD